MDMMDLLRGRLTSGMRNLDLRDMARNELPQTWAQKWLESRGPALLLGAVLLLAFMLRVTNLGGPSFGIDEMLHVYAANELMHGDDPNLPSGYPYQRALLYTYSVALSGKLLGMTESVARMTSVLFGVLTVALVFFIGRQWQSNAAGLVAALLTAVVPIQVAFSRQVRMYTVFQLFYLIFIYLFFQAIEGSFQSRRIAAVGKGALKEWAARLQLLPWSLAAIAFALALHFQQLILVAAAGPIVYVLCMALVALLDKRTDRLARSRYVFWTLVIGAGVALALIHLYVSGGIARYVSFMHYAPAWAQSGVQEWQHYIAVLRRYIPFISVAAVILGGLAWLRNPKPAFYLIVCFAAPFLIHSLFIAWKNQRYVFHLFPLLFLLSGMGLASLISQLREWISGLLARSSRPVMTRVLVGGVGGATMLVIVYGAPELRESVQTPYINAGQFAGVQHNNWRTAMRYIAEKARQGDVIMTSVPLLAKYYGPPRPLYSLNNNELDDHFAKARYNWKTSRTEYTAAAVIVVDLKDLRELIGKYSSGWLVIERNRFHNKRSVPADISAFIERNFQIHDVDGAEDMLIFRWGRWT
jgi:4-amino-4-deoxy-L-arabinose transferase-like glycosyltransferase